MTLDQIRGKPELSKQLDLMERLARALDGEAACMGAAVGGSLASGTADAMSDVDLLVYCEAGAAIEVLAKLSKAAAVGAVVYRLEGRHDLASVFEKVILEDWSSYEIHVIEPSTRMRLKASFLELLNRGRYLETRRSDDKPIGRDTLKPLVNGQDGLVWEIFNCMKWLRRGEHAFTSEYLQQLGMALKLQSVKQEMA